MSVQPVLEPACHTNPATAAISTIIDGRAKDLDGFSVRRVLPSMARRMVGPVIFFDHMGPAAFQPGQGIAVRPHPHIGLATVTYLFEGEIIHRDSLGFHQAIRPGAINWMTAGSGIVHSERMSEAARAQGGRLHGIQLWVALPVEHEETAPSFIHHSADVLPQVTEGGVQLRVLVGQAYGVSSPVETLSPLFYVEAILPAGTALELPEEHAERAAYVVSGSVRCGAEEAELGRMLVFGAGAGARLQAATDARVMLLGGERLEGKRHIFWNFVSSRKDRLDQAKLDWEEGRFPHVPGDEQEFIALPK